MMTQTLAEKLGLWVVVVSSFFSEIRKCKCKQLQSKNFKTETSRPLYELIQCEMAFEMILRQEVLDTNATNYLTQKGILIRSSH